MSFIRLSNPLTYPGGSPGINTGHPVLAAVASGVVGVPPIAFSGVGISGIGSFRRLDRAPIVDGKAGTPTGTLDGQIGPSWTSTAADGKYTSFWSGAPAGGGARLTVATIFKATSIAFLQAITSVGANSSDNFGITILASTGVLNLISANTNNATSVTIAANTPYFLATSIGAGGVVVGVIRNLSTGAIQAFTLTVPVGSPLANVPAIVIGNWILQLIYSPAAKIAAVAYIDGSVPLNTLVQWAGAPWDFWYPATVQKIVLSIGRGGKAPIDLAGNLGGVSSYG